MDGMNQKEGLSQELQEKQLKIMLQALKKMVL